MPEELQIRTLKRKNVKSLALGPHEPNSAATELQQPSKSNIEDILDDLEVIVEFRLDLMPEDFEIKDLVTIDVLHNGPSGMVSKVKHVPSGVIMAKRDIHLESKMRVRRQIERELQMIRDCSSENLVKCYGAIQKRDGDVAICTELMDMGSIAQISRATGPLRIDILGKVAEAILSGITYLHTNYHIMHRNLKSSKILINSLGHIKLSDFSVSGELVNSVAETVVGSGMEYIAPERIQGAVYTIKSEVWSFGMIVLELAVGCHPYSVRQDEEFGGSLLDLLQRIVYDPSPKLPEDDAFPKALHDLVNSCLMKDPDERPTPQALFNKDPFILASKATEANVAHWVASLGDLEAFPPKANTETDPEV